MMAAQSGYSFANFQKFFFGSSTKIEFSEGLLRTLCDETDIGPIPREIDLDVRMNKPKYMYSTNWNFSIQGCYWCSETKKALFGIYCSKECLFYFHDWCIGRVELLTQRRFCRFPGCDRACVNSSYCDTTHKNEFGKAFPQWMDQESLSKKLLRNGPHWYDSNSLNNQPTINPPESKTEPSANIFRNDKSKSSEHLQNKLPSEIKVRENPDKYIPIEFRDYLIFQTDIGIIPRENPSEQQLASPYSLSPNWKKEIHGCYCCGDKLSASTGNSCLCSYSCYLIFYEWCRRKIKSFTGITLCKFPGCMKPVIADFDYCNNEHAQMIEGEYARVKKLKNVETLVERDPNWYSPHHIGNPRKQLVTNEISQSKLIQNTQPIKDNKQSPNFVFAWKLTNFVYHRTDVGPIPREILPLMPPPPHKIIDSNWNAEIPECYWCCTHPKKNSVVCSNKCFFLFNEWLHRKYTKLSKRKLCKYFRCESYSSPNFECCKPDHSLKYDKLKGFRPLLKSTEFALGPKWYDDAGTTHIDFYNSDEPFYEFTNFYNCEKLFVDLISWTTSEHAFQGNKFVGTPLMTYVSSLDTLRKPFEFARIPTVQRWIRPDWHSIETQIMLNVLRHKFVQNPDLADILNRTGGKHIYEHTSNDKFWGDGGDRRGANKLGELLMKVRTELRINTPYLPNTLNHFMIPDKVDIPPNQTPTSSSLGILKQGDVNPGTGNQNKSKTDTPPDQTPTSSSLGNIKQRDVNPGTGNQNKSKTDAPPDQTPTSSSLGDFKHGNVNLGTGNLNKSKTDTPPYQTPTSSSLGDFKQGDVNPGTGEQNKSKTDTPPDQTPTSSSPDSSSLMDLNTRTGNQETSKGNIPPKTHSQTFSLPTSSVRSDIKINVFKFSNKLCTNLSQYTDVGLTPRRSGQQNHTSDQFPPRNPCSNVDIVGCYWCGNSNTCFEEMACGVRCWLLLHEWCVRRVEQVCRLKLCGLPGCEEPRVDPCECCSIEHAKERSLLIGGVSIRLPEEIELTLGPKWYRDLTPICFSESGPFSELSNSFPSLLNLYHMIWPTVHHCMCAQKLLGTPYLHHVRKMERLHELEEWEVRCVKWVRPDWEGVRKRVLYQALMAKFQQNCVLKGLLLRTGSRPLVCRDNAHLGDMLMSVREVLKAATFLLSMNCNSSISDELFSVKNLRVDSQQTLECSASPTNNPVSDYPVDPHQPPDPTTILPDANVEVSDLEINSDGESTNNFIAVPFNACNVPLNPECHSMQFSASSYQTPDSTTTKINAISESYQTPDADTGESKLPDEPLCPLSIPSSSMSGNEPMEVGYNESTNVEGKPLLNLVKTKAEKDDIPESDQTPIADASHTESNSGYSRQDGSYAVSSTVEQERESDRNSIQTTGSDPIQGTNTPIAVLGEAKHQFSDGYVCPFIGEDDSSS